jgi:hypothetical protein
MNYSLNIRFFLTSLLLAGLTTACDQGGMDDNATGSFLTKGAITAMHGKADSQIWSATAASCTVDNDCLYAETCIDNVCQVARCQGFDYDSLPPMGQMTVFVREAEIVVSDAVLSDGKRWLDPYELEGDGLSHRESLSVGPTEVIDIAAGNLLGSRPDAVAVLHDLGEAVTIRRHDTEIFFLHGLKKGVALTVGDVDGDHTDEVIVVSNSGHYAICEATIGHCEIHEIFGGYHPIDVAATDVDADGRDELVFIATSLGQNFLIIENVDAPRTGQSPGYSLLLQNDPPSRVAAGDLDGDGRGEIVTLSDGGWGGWVDDEFRTYKLRQDGSLAYLGINTTTDDDAVDLDIGDVDGDGQEDLGILTQSGDVRILRLNESLSFEDHGGGETTDSDAPLFLALADMNGDSAVGHLVTGPEPVSGEVVPLAVLHFPPFDDRHSKGLPLVRYGTTSSEERSISNSVSLNLRATLGWKGSLFKKLNLKTLTEIKRSSTFQEASSTNHAVATGFQVRPNVEAFGPQHAGVVLAWGCYHGYTYRMDDPMGFSGSETDGGEFVVVLPVSGGSTLWSSTRYNQMAAAIEGLPIMDVPHVLGDPESYPEDIRRVDGSTIPMDDMLFPHLTARPVSDAARVSWGYTVHQSETNANSLVVNLSNETHIKFGGFRFSWDSVYTPAKAYSVVVGESTRFGGELPEITDDPSTPEDEYSAHAYTTIPYVYREHYRDAANHDAAYFVMYYAVK